MFGLRVFTVYGIGKCKHQNFDDRVMIEGGDFVALAPLEEILEGNPQLNETQKEVLQNYVGKKADEEAERLPVGLPFDPEDMER